MSAPTMSTSMTPALSAPAKLAVAAVVAALLVAAPFGFYPVLLMKVMCFALFACAFNLLPGYAGLLSFGHAMFFGGASYICAHTIKEMGFPPEAGILAGTAFAAALGLVAGALAIRRQGIYFAMVTLALRVLAPAKHRSSDVAQQRHRASTRARTTSPQSPTAALPRAARVQRNLKKR